MRRNVAWSVSFVLLSSAFVVLAAIQLAFAQATPSGPTRTYVCLAELIAFDGATKVMTAKAAVNEAVVKYVDRFKPGQHVVLVWTADNSKPETGPVRYIEAYDTLKTANVNQGYILPVEFVAADAAARTVTFKARVPEAIAQTLTAIQPGRAISVTAPMSQPTDTAVIASIEASDRPQSKASETAEEGARKPRTR